MEKEIMYPAHVEISFEPIWGYISCVRSFVSHFFSVGLKNEIEADKISLAVSELLENAVKYSYEPEISISISISLNRKGGEKKVIVSVRNKAKQFNIEELKKETERINNGEPEQIYLEKMREAVSRPSGQAGLGLIRIRLVSREKVEYNVTGNDVQIKVVFFCA